MELRRLRYFVAVAEELHVGRAAERLHMAQQPLSAQIRELERELGYDLFERYANRIRLTEAGSVFLSEARAILTRTDAAVELGRRAAEGEIGVVRIGHCSTAAESVLPAAILAMRAAHPDIGLDVREMDEAAQLRALERDTIDIGFLYRPVDERSLAALDLFEDSLVVAVPIAHRFAACAGLDPGELAGEPLVLFEPHAYRVMTAFVEDVLRGAGVAGNVVFRAHQKGSALALAARGVGLTIVTSRSVVPRDDVAYVPLETPRRLRFAAVWSRSAPPRSVRERFLARLRGELPVEIRA
jgi:DNA-binding transcriptional LysR family regulator